LDTLILAGLETEAIAALNHSVSIDFTRADGLVDPFETIIRYHHHQPPIRAVTMGRYIGGLVSAVDLLEYGFLGSPFDPRGLEAIRKQAEILAHKLGPGFPTPIYFPGHVTYCRLNSPMKMWLPRVDFRADRGIREDLWGDTTVSPARAGSNILEYGRLTELSADLEFFRNVAQSPRFRCGVADGVCRRRQRGGLLLNRRRIA